MASRQPAAEVARWHDTKRLWLDHARVTAADSEWIAPAEVLLLWNVKLPDGFLARLPNLRGVSLRGGTGANLRVLEGCAELLWVDVNQIRGLHDLGHLAGLRTLEFLSLHGLPRVERLPDLGDLRALRHVQIGSMKGLQSLAGLISIPALHTLQFIRAVKVSADDLDLLAAHPTLEAFEWFHEDVPDRVAAPVIQRLSHLKQSPLIRPEDWLEQRLRLT